MDKRTIIGIGLLAFAGIGAYLYWRHRQAKWFEELAGGIYLPPPETVPTNYGIPVQSTIQAPSSYAKRLSIKYQVPVIEVSKLIERIPESKLGAPPEVVAEKILSQEFA